MRRTINEVYNLINEKKENALNDLVRPHNPTEANQLKGEIEAYTDVLILIASSGVLAVQDKQKAKIETR